MSYCLNPNCQKPQNPPGTKFCFRCGYELLLKNQYRAIQPIGEGGFGKTFLAEDAHRLNACCVIKQFFPLPQIQGNSEAMAKATQLFEQEARQLLELGEQHPQIPTLFGYFEQDKRLYLVQQFIDGQDLSKELDEQGVFSEQEIRELLNDLLPVLQFVHKHQVIHRDIKPTNILRRKSDRKFVLIDFGVSKHLTGTGLTKTGTKAGTEGYAPIEQLRGGKAYPASDLYSLGVTCIHLLTAAELEDLYDPLEGNWLWRSRLRERGKNVSTQLSQVLDKLLKDYVKERYQSAGEVLKDLNGVTTPPPMPTYRMRFLMGVLKDLNGVTTPPPPSQPKPQNWRCVQTLTGHTSGHTSYVCSAVFSPDGQTIASVSHDNTIKLWQMSNGKLIHTFTGHSSSVYSVAISPDGQTIVSGSRDNTIKLWQMSNGKPIRTLTGHSSAVRSVVFSPDGQTIASGSDDSTIKLWQLGSGKVIRTVTGHSNAVYSVAFSPDGQTLASGSGDKTIELWHLSSGEVIRTVIGHSNTVRSVAFSPDGQTLASGSHDKTIKIWQLGNGQLIHTLRGHSDYVSSVAFSPDGQTLASGSSDKTIKIWRCD